MAVFTVFIEGFGDLPVTPGFGPNLEFNRRANGQVQSLRDVWRFEGILGEDGTAEVGLKAKRDALIVAFQQRSTSVEFRANGLTFERIGPPVHPRGAFFRNFNVNVTGGEWVSLLQYTFEVVGERAGEIPNVFDATRRFETTIEDGRLRARTTIDARGPGAVQFVTGLLPAAASRAVIVEVPENDTASVTFELDGAAEGTTLVTEEVEVEPGLFPIEFVRPTRANQPVEFFSSRNPTIIRINGSITAKKGEAVAPPVSPKFARFLSQFRIGRTVVREGAPTSFGGNTQIVGIVPNAGQSTETVTYFMEFRTPFQVSVDEVARDRAAFGIGDYKSEQAGGVSIPTPGFTFTAGIGGGLTLPTGVFRKG